MWCKRQGRKSALLRLSKSYSIAMSLYAQRGVSAQKEEVHQAVQQLNQGLYLHAFCKIYPDFLGNDADWVNVMHADGAGTKSILAYLYWKQTGDTSIWKGIAQDAIVMNLDDLLCVGIYNNIVFNSTIDRNKHKIPGDVLSAIINGSQEVFDMLSSYGVNIHYLGGETADVGDVVRTVAVNGTMTCRWPKNQLITNNNIAAGQVIVGLASFGQCQYENEYNSGLGSNGLTSARHDVLSKYYAENYPESFDGDLKSEVVYIGKQLLTDPLDIPGFGEVSIGKLLLSPTRTYAPVMVPMLTQHFQKIAGVIHCSGGGQTKCLKYLPQNLHIVKNNLFAPPPVFELIQQNSGSSLQEMYEVFNMGCRLELYCAPADAATIINTAKALGIAAQVIGHVEESDRKHLSIITQQQTITYGQPNLKNNNPT
jgi:phosphoribosylformylglycinamidine cyclo-ligase